MDPITAAALGWGAVYGIGKAAGWWGKKKKQEPQFYEPPPPKFYEEPRFPETEAARQTWWDKVKAWSEMPGYGAIAPDWGDIWGRAKKRISQYYWGGPGGEPGLAAKVRASAARRGVAESPALETGLRRMGYQEAAQLEDIATEQALQEALFGERGRESWLGQISRIAGLKVPGKWQGAMAYTPPADTSWSDLATAIGSYLGGMGQRKWYEEEAEKERNWYRDLLESIYGGGREKNYFDYDTEKMFPKVTQEEILYSPDLD